MTSQMVNFGKELRIITDHTLLSLEIALSASRDFQLPPKEHRDRVVEFLREYQLELGVIRRILNGRYRRHLPFDTWFRDQMYAWILGEGQAIDLPEEFKARVNALPTNYFDRPSEIRHDHPGWNACCVHSVLLHCAQVAGVEGGHLIVRTVGRTELRVPAEYTGQVPILLDFTPTSSLSPTDQQRYRQERAKAGLVPEITAEDVEAARRQDRDPRGCGLTP